MVQSMTGYGQIEHRDDGANINLEIKTINHRFLDLSLKMPASFNRYEDQIKAVLRSYFKRGRVELNIYSDGSALDQQSIKVNWPLLEKYDQAIQSIQSTYPDTAKAMINGLPDLTEIFQVTEENSIDQQTIETMIDMVNQACFQVTEMRSLEGGKLVKDIEKRIAILKGLLEKLTDSRDEIKDKHYQRMVARLNDLLSKNNLVQDDRFYQELAVLAEKGDLTEELIRIDSHIEQIELLLREEGEIGRKLDFITQELIREANTIGSKANDPMISEYVIDLKATIEKIKEQVQNIE